MKYLEFQTLKELREVLADHPTHLLQKYKYFENNIYYNKILNYKSIIIKALGDHLNFKKINYSHSISAHIINVEISTVALMDLNLVQALIKHKRFFIAFDLDIIEPIISTPDLLNTYVEYKLYKAIVQTCNDSILSDDLKEIDQRLERLVIIQKERFKTYDICLCV